MIDDIRELTNLIKINQKRLAAWQKEKETNKHGMTYLSDRAIKIIHDDIEYLTNRDKSKLPKKSKFWCIYCDAQLVGEWGKCPNCGKRNGRKRRKK